MNYNNRKIINYMILFFIIVLLIMLVYYIIDNISKEDSHRIIKANRIQSVDLIKMSPPNLKIYHSINKYAPKYNIPYKYAYGIVRLETSYMHPFDYSYDHAQTSPTGAEGPFQFIISTARYVSGNRSLSREEIRHNIELNTELSMKYTRMLYDRYKNWNIVFGYYNTGYPIVNSYAIKITS